MYRALWLRFLGLGRAWGLVFEAYEGLGVRASGNLSASTLNPTEFRFWGFWV